MQRAYSVTEQELLTRWELAYKAGGGGGRVREGEREMLKNEQ